MTTPQVYNGFVSRHLNRHLSQPLARLLARTPITPNQVSFAALGLAVMSCLSFLKDHPRMGGVLAQASSVVDGADGDLARIKGKTSDFGGFLDAVLDRYADAFIILGLTLWSAKKNSSLTPWLAGFSATMGTLALSYTRARVAGIPKETFDRGFVALATRDVRLFLIMVGSILGKGLATLAYIALVTNLMVLLRLIKAHKRLNQKYDSEPES